MLDSEGFIGDGWVHDLLLHCCMVAGGIPVVENYPKKPQKLKNHSDLRQFTQLYHVFYICIVNH